MRCKFRPYCATRLIKYLNVVASNTGEYVSSKSILGLCEKP